VGKNACQKPVTSALDLPPTSDLTVGSAGLSFLQVIEDNLMDFKNDNITVYYDGGCPSCIKDMHTYDKLSTEAGNPVTWVDITGREDHLRRIGIDPVRALMELHIQDQNQNVLSEMDAYIVLMNRVPRLKPLAWLIGLPVLRPLLSKLYHWMVEHRLKGQGRL